jgi:hypothetical protein
MKIMNINDIQKNNKHIDILKIKEVQEYGKTIYPVMEELEKIERQETKQPKVQNSQLENYAGNNGLMFKIISA